MTETGEPRALYDTHSAAGAMLGRQLYKRCPPPVVLLGITPTGVEIAAHASKAMGCKFDVVVAAHVRLEGKEAIGAMVEDADAALSSDFQPRFGLMEALESAIDRARRVIKKERLLFRGQRPLSSVAGIHVAVVDGHVILPWKMIAAAKAVAEMGATKVWIAAAACTQQVREAVRISRYEFICPSVLMDAAGHPRPFGDVADPIEERLKSIVIAREAA